MNFIIQLGTTVQMLSQNGEVHRCSVVFLPNTQNVQREREAVFFIRF